MKRKLRNSYNYLDLTYQATIEDVERRKSALIKLFNSKSKEKNVSYDKKIKDVEKAANNIIENIKNNGLPNKEYHRFECGWATIISLTVALAFAVGVCAVSFVCF